MRMLDPMTESILVSQRFMETKIEGISEVEIIVRINELMFDKDV